MLQRYFRAVVVGRVVDWVVTNVSLRVVTVVLLELEIVKIATVVSLCNTGEDVVVRLPISVVLSLSVTMVSGVDPDTNPSSAITVAGGVEVMLKFESVGFSETLIKLVTKTVGSTLLGKRVSVGSDIHWLSLTEDKPSGSLVTGGGVVTSKDVLYGIKGVVAQSVVEFISPNEVEGSIVGVNDGSKYGSVVSVKLGPTSEGSKIVVLKGSNPEMSVEDSSVQELLPVGCRSSSNKAVSM